MTSFTTYPRLPAAIVLLLSAAAIFLYLRHASNVQALDEISGESLQGLEMRIAAEEDSAELWFAYAQRLVEADRQSAAAAAFAQVLEAEPYHREARFGRAIALARAGQADPLFTYLRDLVYSEPRLAVELFDRREVRPFLSEARFRQLHGEAHVQALD